jgi:hypothetical protein
MQRGAAGWACSRAGGMSTPQSTHTP